MCCGKRRSALRHAPTPASPAPPKFGRQQAGGARPASAPAARSVDLRYTDASAVTVWGPATGRRYDFSGADPVQSVDPRDAAILVRTRFFRPA